MIPMMLSWNQRLSIRVEKNSAELHEDIFYLPRLIFKLFFSIILKFVSKGKVVEDFTSSRILMFFIRVQLESRLRFICHSFNSMQLVMFRFRHIGTLLC